MRGPLQKTIPQYRIDQIRPTPLFEVEDHINRFCAQTGARVASMEFGPSGQISILWEILAPNEDWAALIDAMPQKPPQSRVPLQPGEYEIDFTDKFKAQCFDRARAILYGKGAA